MSENLKKIIVVDDVNFMLTRMRESLGKHYQVYPAQSSEILYEILANVIPDLILLDINMPETDGFQIISQLKADRRYAAIPVIFLTGKNDRESIVRGMSLGAVDIVFKPITDRKLVERIEYQFDPAQQELNKPLVLAVDDSPSILNTIRHALSPKYKVYTLPQPEKLTDLLKIVTPDLFLLDLQMPVVSGFDLVPIIRNTTGHEDTPIVFLTSEATNDNIFVAVQLGACDYIVKPVDDAILLTKVAQHIKNYPMLRILRTFKQ